MQPSEKASQESDKGQYPHSSKETEQSTHESNGSNEDVKDNGNDSKSSHNNADQTEAHDGGEDAAAEHWKKVERYRRERLTEDPTEGFEGGDLAVSELDEEESRAANDEEESNENNGEGKKVNDGGDGVGFGNGLVLSTAGEDTNISFREKAFRTLSMPQYSLWASLYAVVICGVVVASVILLILQSFRTLQRKHIRQLFISDSVFNIMFAVDYFARLALARRRLRFIISPMNIIDLLSFVPYFIEFGFTGNGTAIRVLSVLRAIRVLRLLQIGIRSFLVLQFMLAIKKATAGIILLFLVILLLITIYGTLIFYIETESCELDESTSTWIYTSGLSPGEATLFQNIPISMWWAIVTITTVGYGDVYPKTWAGKLVGSATILTAIVVMSFPVTILNSSFMDSFTELANKIGEFDRNRSQSLTVYLRDLFFKIIRRDVTKSEENRLKERRDIDKRHRKQQRRDALQTRNDWMENLKDDARKWAEAVEQVSSQMQQSHNDIRKQILRTKAMRKKLKLMLRVANEQLVLSPTGDISPPESPRRSSDG